MDGISGARHAVLMDGIYRHQRHIYDATRKFYLLGRDEMLEGLAVPPGGNVLEIGCGTGRNLIAAARRYPGAQFYGIDISAEMLKTAEGKLDQAGVGDRARLAVGDAAALDPEGAFGINGFDRIFISYAVSMIPEWPEAVRQAATALKPGGSLHVVDFGQQDRLPVWFRVLLRGWLARFHVAPRAELEAVMREAAQGFKGTMHFQSLYRDYARLGVLRRPA
ncbi:MAG: class I SAM-dependent methyltransferase [Notoacmeibacter sp.]|nr:class I SAM-dependent methyltransferase [Notoacmeibacter sp.]MCC0032834.1 class I SAM-dependent methyltransferase [Brucellaceae bacterium]